jgi:hypothetical protein
MYDLQLYLADNTSHPIVIHDDVLLIHILYTTHQKLQIVSKQLEKIVLQAQQMKVLSKTLHAKPTHNALPMQLVEIPVSKTITLPLPPTFAYEVYTSDTWTCAILVKYLIEVVELPQYKSMFILQCVTGNDYVLQTSIMMTILQSISNPFHRIKLLEHSKLLLQAIIKHRYSEKKPKLMNVWNSVQLAGYLLIDHHLIELPVYLVRRGIDATKISHMSVEECRMVFEDLCASESSSAITALLHVIGSSVDDMNDSILVTLSVDESVCSESTVTTASVIICDAKSNLGKDFDSTSKYLLTVL